MNATFKIRVSYRLIAAILISFLSYLVGALFLSSLSAPHYVANTFIIIVSFLIVVFRSGIFSFQSAVFFIAFFPSLAPIYAWNILQQPYFSLASRHIQTIDLANYTTLVFAVGAVFYAFFACRQKRGFSRKRKRYYLSYWPTFFLGLLTVGSAYVIDPGPTILTANYAQILDSRFEASPIVSFAAASFGALWVAMFCFGRQHKWAFVFFSFVAFAWLLLHVRRVEPMGAVLLLMIWYSYRVSRFWLVSSIGIFLASLIFLEVARSVGIVHFLSGAEETAAALAVDAGRGALPGGASNVFLSGVHLINISSMDQFTGGCCITIWDWFRAPIPNPVWTAVGLPPIRTEHQLIFENLGLVYVGGMPFFGAVYLNGGFILTALFGAIIALLVSRIQRGYDALALNGEGFGATIGGYFFSVFILYIFRFLWYNPQTPIRAMAYAALLYFVLSFFLKKCPAFERGSF